MRKARKTKKRSCVHSWTHLRLIQERIVAETSLKQDEWFSRDFFYCSNCLKYEERTRSVQSLKPPAWWNA